MGFHEDVTRLAAQVANRQGHCKGNEEATKHSLILPMFQVLGYDVHDPSELIPEYKAGFASNKEKIDYAIFLDGAPVLFVEAKAVGEHLDNYDAQLAKYFNSTQGLKLAIITNGIRYKFFTDLKAPNLMDAEPFFEFSMDTIGPEEIETLVDFRRDSIDPAALVTKAENLVYLRALKRRFRALFREPSDDFIRFMASDVYPRKITASALERLIPLVKQAMRTEILEMVSQGLSQEIAKPQEATAVVPEAREPERPAIVTTEEEIAAFSAIYAVIATHVGEDARVSYRDTASYMSVHIEKPSRWFARLFFGASQKAIVLHVDAVTAAGLLGDAVPVEPAGDSCKVKVSDVADIARLAPAVVAAYRAAAGEPVPR